MKLYTVTAFSVNSDDRPRDFDAFPFNCIYKDLEQAKAECQSDLEEYFADDDDMMLPEGGAKVEWGKVDKKTGDLRGTFETGDTVWTYVIKKAEYND